MRRDGDASAVVVTVESRALVLRVGPTAWAVLQDVVLDARPHNGRWLARTSTRRVAEHLGLTPGTVARALARLCTEGIVHREDRRDADTGRFGETVYVVAHLGGLRPCVDLPLTADCDAASPCTAAPLADDRRSEPGDEDQRRSSSPGRRRAAVTEQQLLLADNAPPTTSSVPVNPPLSRTTKPRTPNHQTPTTKNLQHQDPYNTEPLNTTNQRATDSCQLFEQALPGAAAFSAEAGA